MQSNILNFRYLRYERSIPIENSGAHVALRKYLRKYFFGKGENSNLFELMLKAYSLKFIYFCIFPVNAGNFHPQILASII